MALSSEEKETIITFDQSSKIAVIFTYEKAWQKHLEKKLGLSSTMGNGRGGREYEIDKKRIPLPRAKRNLTPEARAKMSKRLKDARNKSRFSSNSLTATVKSNSSKG